MTSQVILQNLPFKLSLDQIPDSDDQRQVYFAVQTLAYWVAKYAGTYLEQPTNYSQLGFENLNTDQLRFYCQANGAITAGDLVYFVASGTTIKAAPARANAIATAAKGVYLGATNLVLNDWAEFQLGYCKKVTAGLTPGSTYYLSTAVAGAIQLARPAVAGQIIQDIGFALSDTILLCNPSKPVILL